VTASTTAAQQRTAWLLVAGQVALLTLLALLPRRAHWPVPAPLRYAGNLAAALGLGFAALSAGWLGRGLTPMPVPTERTELRTTGPYRYVRHPIYAGLLLSAASRAASSGNRATVAAFAALAALLSAKARFEEEQMMTRFPGYRDYAARTPRFVPTLR
jgi:protein-S-isoprenylcysteine O-methyltransferase Ste14